MWCLLLSSLVESTTRIPFAANGVVLPCQYCLGFDCSAGIFLCLHVKCGDNWNIMPKYFYCYTQSLCTLIETIDKKSGPVARFLDQSELFNSTSK